MSSRFLEVAVDDVIWENLNMNPYQKKGRIALSWAATLGLIITWAAPGQSPACQS